MIKTVQKKWGREEWIVNNDKYCGKILHVNAGWCCSLHYHKIKHETFYIRKGCVEIILDGVKRTFTPGMSLEVNPMAVHIFSAIINTEIIEFSTHHEDSDSYRMSESCKVHFLGSDK